MIFKQTKILFILFVFIFVFKFSFLVQAALPGQMNLKYNYEMFVLNINDPNLWSEYEKWFYQGKEVFLDNNKIDNKLLEKRLVKGIDRAYLKNFLRENVAPTLQRKGQGVTIYEKDQAVFFSDKIVQVRRLNVEVSVTLIEKALKEGVDEVELSVFIENPVLDISPELKKRGIQEIIAIGESNFSGSSKNRIHNISTAIKKFNGFIIKKDHDFSFNEVVGTIDGHSGYKKELVIKGPRTIPEWGGGVCQVSSTLYRGLVLSGANIKERGNHSYAVSYYTPWGSDATIYPGSYDLKFFNDFPGDILIQAYIEDEKLYFVFVGTKKETPVSLFGPYITNHIPAPPTQYHPSRTLQSGQKLLISHAHNGFIATWFRQTGTNHEKIISRYEARPKIYKVGGLSEIRIGSLD